MNINDIKKYFSTYAHMKANERIYVCKYYGINEIDTNNSFFSVSVFNNVNEAIEYMYYIMKTIDEDEDSYTILEESEDYAIIYIPSKRETQYIMIEDYIV